MYQQYQGYDEGESGKKKTRTAGNAKGEGTSVTVILRLSL